MSRKSSLTKYEFKKGLLKKQIEEGVSKLRVGIKPETRVIARESTKIFDEKGFYDRPCSSFDAPI